MVRIDVPVIHGDEKEAIARAQTFIEDVGKDLPKEQAEYIFGNE